MRHPLAWRGARAGLLALAVVAVAVPAYAAGAGPDAPDGLVTLMKFVSCALAMATAKTWAAASAALLLCGQVIASQKAQ